ncbi:MAG TPA: hypothetical protein VIY48_20775, partial [Candidatus Paceibacterota bacterium]
TRSVKYSLAKFSDCTDGEGRKITSFTIRTTDGTDESYAAKKADSTGNTMTEELIRFSLVCYTIPGTVAAAGEEPGDQVIDCKQPFLDFDKWSTKARNFVVAAWKRLSTPNEVEIADFFASASETA